MAAKKQCVVVVDCDDYGDYEAEFVLERAQSGTSFSLLFSSDDDDTLTRVLFDLDDIRDLQALLAEAEKVLTENERVAAEAARG